MSREVKLIVFGLILAFAFFNKHFNEKGIDTSIYNTTSPSETSSSSGKKGDDNTAARFNDKKYRDLQNDLKEWEDRTKIKPIEIANTYLPVNGFSPYDRYFGKGVYDNSARNSLSIKTPVNRDIVFLLVDVYSKQVVRNEFIRAGSTFELTGIPYGTYSFKYFSGNKWSDDYPVNNGQYKGGFTKNGNFSKSDKWSDNMTFRRGYSGSYSLTLTALVGGNLETESTTENDFFN
jgi:hypothetical protein